MKLRTLLLALLVAGLAVASVAAMAVMPPQPVGADAGAVTHHVDAVWPCAAFKPHTGDAAPWLHAWNNESNPYIDTADCAATHPGGPDHLYCVVEWHHDGAGNPISPPQYTWQSGWC